MVSNADDGTFAHAQKMYRPDMAETLTATKFDRAKMGVRSLPYERLDQLIIELLRGVRYPYNKCNIVRKSTR